MSGLKTGITIGVYAINRDTGERREIKPEKHFDGEMLTGCDARARYVYQPCRCKGCLAGESNTQNERIGIVCGNCYVEVIEGPRGGYVCGNCNYIVTPDEDE